MLKKLLVVVVVLVVLVGAGLFGLYMYADSLVKAGVEFGGTRATGQATKLYSASLGIFSGEMGFEDLSVANPSGFEGGEFFQLGDAQIKISLGSLMEEKVEIPLIQLRNIDLNIVRNGQGEQNFQVILDHMKALSESNEVEAQPQAEGGASKQFIINKLAIENVTVHVKGYPVEVAPIKLPPIVLENVGSESSGGVIASELAGIVLEQIMQQLLKNPGQLPTMALANLRGGLDQLGKFGEIGSVEVGKIGQQVDQLLDGQAGQALDQLGIKPEGGVEDMAKQAGEDVNKQLEDVTKSLGNFLGEKDQENQ